jgi:hypothetical protein
MDKRILELALETLEKNRAQLQAEIDAIRSGLKGAFKPEAVAAQRGAKSAAERRAQSLRMKAYWAAKRSPATKVQPAGEASSAKPKMGPQSAAAKKAQSLRMKAFWKKKKAEAAKAGKRKP